MPQDSRFFFFVQLQRLAPRDVCLVSPPRNSETSTPPAEAKSASLSESPVSAFLDSRLYFSVSILPMKSKNDFTVRPSDAQDVLDPLATGRGDFRRAALVGAYQALALFVFTQFFWNKTQNPTFSCKFLVFLADIFLIIESSEKISCCLGVFSIRV